MDSKIAGGHWLESSSTEYDLIRYYLTSSTENVGNIEKLSVWKIENHEMIYKFEKRSSGMLRLHGWIKADDLTGENTLEQLCQKGFNFHTNGMEFSVGVIRFTDDKSGNQPFSDEFCYLFYDIAVGRSKIFDGSRDIPDGYDSLYFPQHVASRSKDSFVNMKDYQMAAQIDQRPSSSYQHRYYITDALQVLPRYIVKFRLNKQRFSRILDPHGVDIQYIDPITLQPISAQSMNQNTIDKRALPIEKLYSQATEEIAYADKDAALQSKTQWVQKQLANLDNKTQEIHNNYKEVNQAIEDAAAQAKQKLYSLVHEKLEVCLSMEIELKRQLEQIHWLNDMMNRLVKKYQYAIVDATGNDGNRRRLMYDFLRVWRQHSLILNNISRSRPSELQLLSTLHGDVRIQSDIKLFTDPFYSHGAGGGGGGGGGAGMGSGHSTTGSNNELYNPMEHYVQDFLHRAHEYNMFSTPIRTSIPYISPAIQQIIDQEMETIQELIEKEQLTSPCHLPLSLTQPFQAPESASHPIAVHALIESLKQKLLDSHTQQQYAVNGAIYTNANYNPAIESEMLYASEEALKTAFIQAIPGELGLSPNAITGMSNTNNNHNNNMISPTNYMNTQYAAAATARPTVDMKRNGGRESMSRIVRPGANHPESMSRSFGMNIPPGQQVSFPGGGGEDQSQRSRGGGGGGRNAHHQEDYTTTMLAKETNLPEDLTKVSMALPQLQQIASRYKSNALSEYSTRKQKQIQKKLEAGIYDIGFHALKKSRLLLPNDVESLYFNLPFFAKPPIVNLIYSTHEHRRSLEELYSKTAKNRNPTLLLIRSGDYRFGAYLSHPPLPTSIWSGSPACFLFSLTLNLKIPFHARHVLGDISSSLEEPLAFLCEHNLLFIGNGDLSIDEGLTNGSSELENSYGLGFQPKSASSMCLLAGSPIFTIDDVEVWTIYS